MFKPYPVSLSFNSYTPHFQPAYVPPPTFDPDYYKKGPKLYSLGTPVGQVKKEKEEKKTGTATTEEEETVTGDQEKTPVTSTEKAEKTSPFSTVEEKKTSTTSAGEGEKPSVASSTSSPDVQH